MSFFVAMHLKGADAAEYPLWSGRFCRCHFAKTKEEKYMKKKGIAVAGILLVLLCVIAGFMAAKFKPQTTAGEKEVAVVVVHGNQEEKTFTFQTDAEYLREVLEENELVEGQESQYGLFITSVDGEAADDTKQQWWCITKGGEQVNTSADEVPVQDGDQYELTLKEGY